MMNDLLWCVRHPLSASRVLRFVHKINGYEQKTIDFNSVMRWVEQFPVADREVIISLLPHIRYYSGQATKDILVRYNNIVLERLKKAGVNPDHIIYVTVDEPGSSSHLMLNLLRDAAFLQKRGVHIIDSRNILDLVKCSNNLGTGAIIYVDDFAGTGNQFLASRNYVAENVPLATQFSEFALFLSVCEEAHASISKAGVEVVAYNIHQKSERPLHPDSILLTDEAKTRLVELSAEIDMRAPLGYKDLASMVVFFRNAPNGLPPLFRGNVGQDKKIGLIPRNTDFHTAL